MVAVTFALAFGSAAPSSLPEEGARSTDVQFAGSGGLMLRGTLTRPAGAGPSAGVLLLPGSGPTDRNGNQPPGFTTNLLKLLADRLARDGIASLRFDKRAAHVYAAAWPGDVEGQNRFFSWPRFTEDAKLAYLFLKRQPGIDPKRVGILGHSEGGLIALQVASTLDPADRPAVLVLAGTPGRTLATVVHNQVSNALARQKATPEQVAFFIDKTDGICREVIRTGKAPADVPAGLAALFPANASLYLQEVLALDPLALAGRVSGPVLVLNGERDIQVSPDKDSRPLAAALRKRKQAEEVELVIVPGASHNLKDASADPAGFAGPVVPAAEDRLAAWLKMHLSGGRQVSPSVPR